MYTDLVKEYTMADVTGAHATPCVHEVRFPGEQDYTIDGSANDTVRSRQHLRFWQSRISGSKFLDENKNVASFVLQIV